MTAEQRKAELRKTVQAKMEAFALEYTSKSPRPDDYHVWANCAARRLELLWEIIDGLVDQAKKDGFNYD